MQAQFPDDSCSNLAGLAKVSNTFEILNSTDQYSGLRVTLNSGNVGGQNSTVVFELKCDVNGTDGKILFIK